MATRSKSTDKLTKAETVALFHAIDNYALMVRQMNGMENVTPEQIEAEKRTVSLAKSALRKVNRLRVEGH